MNVVGFCRENRYAVFLVTACLIVAGVVAALRLPSNIYPELNFPRILVLAHSGDLAPESMLLIVTRPLEEAAGTVLGVRRVRSKTIRGATEISVLFNPDTDMQYALQLMQARVSEARSTLPPDTEVQVERVEVQATDTREVSVIVNPQKMLAHRVSLVEVADRLRSTNQVTSVGRLQKDYLQYLVLTTGQFANLEEIRNTVVAIEGQVPIRVRDIAEVTDGVEDRRTLITGNGRPAALVNISAQIGANLLQLASQVKQLASNPGAALPSTLRLSVVYDLAEFVSSAIANVRDAILMGAALAVLILFIFLREGRTTLISSTSLPLSVIGTFFFLRLFGGTLNLMSLGGLAIAIGLIIDDAVVVMENIYRHLGLGRAPVEAAEIGTRELLGPVVGSTATTLVVFLPLGLLTGVVGEFFRALCLTHGDRPHHPRNRNAHPGDAGNRLVFAAHRRRAGPVCDRAERRRYPGQDEAPLAAEAFDANRN